MNLITFNHISGVPIHYARDPVAPYGTAGKGPRKVRLDKHFHEKLEICLTELWSVCPHGKPDILVSGGCYVDKPGTHGKGRAIDIDAIWWPSFVLITNEYPKYKYIYLAIEAMLRKHFGVVLGYLYNSAHRDHWHVDDSRIIRFNYGSVSEVVFVQAALKEIFKKEIRIDSIWGMNTERSAREVLSELDGVTDNLEDLGSWYAFLDATALVGFGVLERV